MAYDYSVDEYIVQQKGYDFFVNHNNSLNTINNLYSSFQTSRLGHTIYPEDFGGMYIDENGNLILMVVGLQEEGTISRFSDDGITKEANFSFNEILELHSYISYLFMNHYTNPIIANIATSGVDVINNNITIALFDYTEEQINLFERYITDSPIVVFKEFVDLGEQVLGYSFYYNYSIIDEDYNTDENYDTMLDCEIILLEESYIDITPLSTTLAPGDRIYIRRGNQTSRLSIGFRASNGRNGFVTAAHGFGGKRAGDLIFDGNNINQIGVVGPNPRLQGIDAAFVELNSNVTISATLGSINLTPTIANPVVGQFVTSRGTPSGSRGGTIASVNQYAVVDNIRFENTAVVNIRSAAGDSGGIVFSQLGPATVGAVQGIAVTQIGTTQTRMSKASQITSTTGWRTI